MLQRTIYLSTSLHYVIFNFLLKLFLFIKIIQISLYKLYLINYNYNKFICKFLHLKRSSIYFQQLWQNTIKINYNIKNFNTNY